MEAVQLRQQGVAWLQPLESSPSNESGTPLLMKIQVAGLRG